MGRTARAGVLAAALLAACGIAAAQDAPVGLQFGLSNPGARSLALGGAFAGLADDATAAFVNPAGLVQLARYEFMLEGRLWAYDTPYTSGGRVAGAATGIGLDVTDGLRRSSSSATLEGVSFASFVYPRERWAVAVYRHVSANFETESRSQGFFAGLPGVQGAYRYDDSVRSTELELINWGAVAGVRVASRVDIGLGVSYYEGRFTNTSALYALDDPALDTVIPGVPPSFPPGTDPGLFDPTSYLPARLDLTAVTAIDDTDWSFNAGVLVRVDDRWQLGAFYRRAPEFDLRLEIRSGPGIQGAPPGTLLRAGESGIRFPDVFGLGVAYRSRDGRLTVVGEWDRVEYSSLVDSLDPTQIETSGSNVDDGDEVRVGLEWVFVRTKPILAARVGAWRDPDHQITSQTTDPYYAAISPAVDDEIHVSAGLGLALESWQFDVAADLSDPSDTYSASAIFKF